MTNLCLNPSEDYAEGSKASTTTEKNNAFLLHRIDRAFSPCVRLRIDYLALWAWLVSRRGVGAGGNGNMIYRYISTKSFPVNLACQFGGS